MKTPSLLIIPALLSFAFSAFAGDAVSVFDGTSLDGWQTKDKKQGANKWVLGEPSVKDDKPQGFSIEKGEGKGKAMINDVTGHGQSWDIFSKAKFGSGRIEVELMVAKGSNSGVYVMGEYEVQILDSFGKVKMEPIDMGAIYGAKPAMANPCKKPGEWQKYEIDFQAPKFDAAGKKIANAKFIKVTLNGVIVQQDVEMAGPTPGGVTGKEAAIGPVMFQGDHGAVAFRNISFTAMEFGK